MNEFASYDFENNENLERDQPNHIREELTEKQRLDILEDAVQDIMAEFVASRIIRGKLQYKQVPLALKEKVKQILIEEGFEDLVTE